MKERFKYVIFYSSFQYLRQKLRQWVYKKHSHIFVLPRSRWILTAPVEAISWIFVIGAKIWKIWRLFLPSLTRELLNFSLPWRKRGEKTIEKFVYISSNFRETRWYLAWAKARRKFSNDNTSRKNKLFNITVKAIYFIACSLSQAQAGQKY